MSPIFCLKFTVCHLIPRKHLPFSPHNEQRKRKKIDFPSRTNIFLSWTGHWMENYVRFSISHYWSPLGRDDHGKGLLLPRIIILRSQEMFPLSFLFKSFSHDSRAVIPGPRTHYTIILPEQCFVLSKKSERSQRDSVTKPPE